MRAISELTMRSKAGKPSTDAATIAKAVDLPPEVVERTLTENAAAIDRDEGGAIRGLRLVRRACELGLVVRVRNMVGDVGPVTTYSLGDRILASVPRPTNRDETFAMMRLEDEIAANGPPIIRNVVDLPDDILNAVWSEPKPEPTPEDRKREEALRALLGLVQGGRIPSVGIGQ